MLEGYNGKIIINWGVNVFFETLGRFLFLCLNVGGVFVIFPKIKRISTKIDLRLELPILTLHR